MGLDLEGWSLPGMTFKIISENDRRMSSSSDVNKFFTLLKIELKYFVWLLWIVLIVILFKSSGEEFGSLSYFQHGFALLRIIWVCISGRSFGFPF